MGYNICMKKLLIIGDPKGTHSMSALRKCSPEDITVWENDSRHFYTIQQISDKINLVEELDRNMQFDLSIGNPPFKGQLHLEFLSLLLDISKEVKLIHPSGWLTRNDKQIEREVKDKLKGRVSKLTIFVGIAKFPSAQFQAPLVITEVKEKHEGPIEVYYDNTGNTYYIDSLDDFPTGYWEPTDVNLGLKELISKEAKKSNVLSLRTSNLGKNTVPLNLPTICGDFRSKDPKSLTRNDTYLFYYPNSNLYTHENNEGKFYAFNSVEERDSLLSYLKTKFARFALALNKATNRNNVSRYIESVPLPPLDRNWTEESVMEYYGLTETQKDSINQFIPTYYK